ncbi:GNAT family N-acetyltransferase [Niveispirillum fermenti]|uniref:GNAT family N-acetyltransferase n=1 Tax=Niveispirillum fermenti TaxID=1233113 RepID=UPI003A86D766
MVEEHERPCLRDATPADLATIFRFVRDLADYEKLADQVVATEADFGAALFGDNPRAFALIIEVGGIPAGFALWFYNFSTFLGRHGIWIEDVYVAPQFRGRGLGGMVFRHLARRVVDEGLGRLEWWVLDWNEPAIDFYQGIGAVPMDEWTVQRVTGEALLRLAGQAP